jgi:hypothetical protein
LTAGRIIGDYFESQFNEALANFNRLQILSLVSTI